MTLFRVFGKAPAGPRLQRILRSSHYAGGSFQNLVHTDITLKDVSFLKMLKEYCKRPVDTTPPQPLPSVRTDLRTLPDDRATLVWFGHSSYLLKIGATHILVDPVFSGDASPVSFFAKAFPGTDVYGVDDMPDTVEALLLTHDHYDHLDYPTIRCLKERVTHFYTALGVGAHLESWGVDPARITELDWWESCGIDAKGRPTRTIEPTALSGRADEVDPPVFSLTAAPARHFSGRSFKRGATCWAAFVLKTTGGTPESGGGAGLSLFLGGDSGYEQHFKTIGQRFGPFDLAILECGQYGKNWPYIHMLPEETVQAAQDLRAITLLPVHWGKFTLSLHPWNEPIRRLRAAAEKQGIPITTPRIGEPVILKRRYPNLPWYDLLNKL